MIRPAFYRFVTGSAILGLIAGGLMLTLSSCFPPYEPVAQAAEGPLSFRTLDVAGQPIFFAEAGPQEGPLVLFVHGTPGSWQGYADYLSSSLADSARLVAVDRPGFGQSPAAEGVPDLATQASLLTTLAAELDGRPLIIVGHSLGGTIAYRMAIDAPRLVAGVVVVSSSIDPQAGKPRWYNHLGNSFLVRWMLPTNLRKANDEIMPLEAALDDMTDKLAALPMPVTVIHGYDDRLVSYSNLEFARRHLPQATQRMVSVPEMGHFVLWEKPDLVAAEIARMVARLAPPVNDP